MAKKRHVNPQKLYIDNLEVKNFRLVDYVELQPGRLINLFAGKNGTAKSTLLGMIAQGFSFNPKVLYNVSDKELKELENKPVNSLTDEEKEIIAKCNEIRTYTNKWFESNVRNHFNLSPLDAKGVDHAVIKMKSKNSSDIVFKIGSNDYTDRKNPRLVTRRQKISNENDVNSKNDVDSSSSNVIYPLIYVSLSRVVPLVQSGKLNEVDLGLSQQDITEIHSLYESILLKKYSNTQKGISNNRSKNTVAFMPPERSLEMISSGEDNVGQILLSLYSFKKLKNNYADYQGGILLIDEIDATLYPAAQNKLMDVIYEKAREFGVQVFATTHSLSLIEHTMNFKFVSRYHTGAVELFSLSLENNEELKINKVNNIQILKNEFFASISEQRVEEKIQLYFEDKEAIYMFKALINSTNITKYLKINNTFTMGCTELLKLRKLNVAEFTHNSIVVLDGDKLVPSNYKNYLNLPVINQMPPEAFVFNILDDDKSNYWRKAKDYTHSNFMNNRYYNVIRQIVNGTYGNESQESTDGPYNSSGGEFENVEPRVVWKKWFNTELPNFKGPNNPIKYWKSENENSPSYLKFIQDFSNSFNYVAKIKGINISLSVKDGKIITREID